MQPGNVRHLTAQELARLMAARQIILVDVREPAEFAAERIAGAVPHPLSNFDPAALPTGEVVFQCGSGKRSLVAIERAVAAGLAHTTHLAGGLTAWKAAGLPVARGQESASF